MSGVILGPWEGRCPEHCNPWLGPSACLCSCPDSTLKKWSPHSGTPTPACQRIPSPSDLGALYLAGLSRQASPGTAFPAASSSLCTRGGVVTSGYKVAVQPELLPEVPPSRRSQGSCDHPRGALYGHSAGSSLSELRRSPWAKTRCRLEFPGRSWWRLSRRDREGRQGSKSRAGIRVGSGVHGAQQGPSWSRRSTQWEPVTKVLGDHRPQVPRGREAGAKAGPGPG